MIPPRILNDKNRFWKHYAFQGIPFNIEMFPKGNIRPDAVVQKLEILDRFDEVLHVCHGPFYRDQKKKLIYCHVPKDVSARLPVGYLIDKWYLLDAYGNTFIINSAFILHSSVFIGPPPGRLSASIVRMDVQGDDELMITIDTADPLYTIERAVFKAFDPSRAIEYDWWHEVAPKKYLFKFKESLLDNTLIEATIYGVGFEGNQYVSNMSIRLNPTVIVKKEN